MRHPPADLPHPLTGVGFPSPVPAGRGWPEDLAGPATPVAVDPDGVRRLASGAVDLDDLSARSSVCRACPRLVQWRESVAVGKRRAFALEPYWGRPIPGWGDPRAWLLVVGLAPAAHGGNRTGRIFTGDRSGDWIFAALHRAGLAVQAASAHAGDGQRLVGTRMVPAVRCAPPDNAPLPGERDTCSAWLDREVTLVAPTVRSVLVLGAFAWEAALACAARLGWSVARPADDAGTGSRRPRRPRFGHGAEVTLLPPGGSPVLLAGSYHVSQQNTFTGRLTEPMLDAVLASCAAFARQE